PGFVRNPYSYMRAVAVFVLTSRWEGFGNVLAEAMACGTPVVSTDCPSGPAEIIKYAGEGLLADVGKPLEISRKIEIALDSWGSISNPNERVLRGFSQAAVAELYLRLLLE